jgi:hypothetical protein
MPRTCLACSSPERRSSQRETGRIVELAMVSAVVLAVSLFLWWRFLPLPDGDLGFYTEPAVLLAKFGKLTGPASQYIDLTYQKGMYNYPPGHFLILATWIKLFGLSPDSLLGYTHAVHAGILILLWVLLRFRYACSKLISALVLLSIFPRMPHGRPDLPACLLSLAAWLALPESENWNRVLLSGCFAGATLLVSPGYGIGIVATLTVLILTRAGPSLGARWRKAAIWLTSAGVVFTAVTAAVLSIQHSWLMAYLQFRDNLIVRGSQVNVLPDIYLLFTWIFSIVPFLLLAVLPAFTAALITWRDRSSTLRNVSLAFLGGTVVWFALNKSQLLIEHHYMFPPKSIFLGLLCSRPRFPVWTRVAPLLLLSVIGFYFYKSNFLYFTTPLRDQQGEYSAGVHPVGEVAVDSVYFAKFYRAGQTLNYEFINPDYWPRFLAAIPPRFREEVLSGLQTKPVEPSMLLVSAATAWRYGEPYYGSLACARPPEVRKPLRALGRTWKLPAQPFALIVCAKAGPQPELGRSLRILGGGNFGYDRQANLLLGANLPTNIPTTSSTQLTRMAIRAAGNSSPPRRRTPLDIQKKLAGPGAFPEEGTNW